MQGKVFDVIQVGYGPVSAALALMLGRQGRSVAVVERWAQRYPLPRAVCIDHELHRVLSANGMGDTLAGITEDGPLYQWFNAQWKELLTIDWSAPSVSGGPETYFVHQPTLEAALDDAVSSLPTVERYLGWEVTAVQQEGDLAHVEMRSGATQETRRLSARFVVGCDGANSIVREAIGASQSDKGFEADWLVIDVLLKEGRTISNLGIPPAAQYCNPIRPTTIVPAGVREGRIFRRWEFMRLPGETNEELEDESKVWELLAPWAGPDDIELVRHKVYNFRSLTADQWRKGRLLIAGDAAHVMPPFMGQGMCSGLRDAWNLSWKLGFVLDGRAGATLLETYQPERHPHVDQITDISIYLGKIICTPDPEAAAQRDEAFLSRTAPPPPPFPSLTDGILLKVADGRLAPGAGLLSPHVEIKASGTVHRLDDFIAGKFALITRGFAARSMLDIPTLSALSSLNVQFLNFADQSGGAVQDIVGRLDAFLDQHGWAAMIIRPDFYVYGGVGGASGLQYFVTKFLSDLSRAGLDVFDERRLPGDSGQIAPDQGSLLSEPAPEVLNAYTEQKS